MSEARRFIVSGRVQGVGFRAFVVDAARRGGVAGWVRNLPDGRVEVFAEGPAGAIETLAEACRRGPMLARVDAVAQHEASAEGREGFRQVADG
ncbi:acylphosphatase [Elioraea rosea]|uniref:acylphosphatase n=1 Tax=Elioraea rosea TaxID=2492390 RepID=UPI00118660F4|nr:acylphosphatase [Elioraea rosea]